MLTLWKLLHDTVALKELLNGREYEDSSLGIW